MDGNQAYRVPFKLEESSGVLLLTNTSDEALPWVRVDCAPGGLCSSVAPGAMGPGESATVYAGKAKHSPTAALMVTWLRHGGDGPYIWRAVV